MEIYQTSKPYKSMRYPTAGDYIYHPGVDLFRFIIAEMPSDYQSLIFLHEYIEAYLCWKAGIEELLITAFDTIFEAEREQGLHGPDDEPGDDPRSPYYEQHQIATRFEKDFCKELKIDWDIYNKAIEDLE